MLIRNDFIRVRNRINPILFNKNITDIHLSFGLNDKDGLTIRFSKLILEHFPELKLHIAIGNKFNYLEELHKLSNSSIKVSWLKDTKNIENQMAKCQIAIGSPGMITWERACLGLPSIQIGSSIEQVEIMNKLQPYEFLSWLGLANKLDDIIFIEEFRKLIENPLLLKKMNKNCLKIVDGLGLDRVCRILLNL
tara:strand:- start:100 stop:678 length:579 start_codon:yes stop_codon:yes gene_type:complete